MKRIKELIRRHGKKGLIIYLCWCLLKGLAFLYFGSWFWSY